MHTVCFEKEILKSFVSFFFVFKIFSFSTELSLLRKHTKNQMCTHYQGIHSFLAKLPDSEPALSHLRPAAELPEATGGSDVICFAQEARSAWPRAAWLILRTIASCPDQTNTTNQSKATLSQTVP